ncbi:MAG: hypothetical protein M3Y31_08170 [Gemmatimonadota bacterium]|nr:hypothetical protein [Gemmatimonadota bacterium]
MQQSVALEQERLLLAERLLSEIERRHGLPHHTNAQLNQAAVDRFLVAYLPETRDGEPVPQSLEFAFAPTIDEATALLSRVASHTSDGWGSACYIHDLSTGDEPELEQ